MTLRNWKLVFSETLIENQWIKIRRDLCIQEKGKIIPDYYVVEKPDYTMIIPITDEGKFIIVSQYKHPSGKIVYEFPAGYLKSGENPIDCARRELMEETGYEAGNLTYLGSIFTSPAVLTNRAHFVLATKLKNTFHQKLDPNENIDIHLFDIKEIYNFKLNENKLSDVSSYVGLYLALPYIIKEFPDLIRF